MEVRDGVESNFMLFVTCKYPSNIVLSLFLFDWCVHLPT